MILEKTIIADQQQDNDNIANILGGHIFFQTLVTGVKFDLFSLLESDGPLTQVELCFKLNIKERPMRILLLGLVSLKLVNIEEGYFSNTSLASKYLVKNSPKCICNIVLWQSEINYQAMAFYYEATVSGDNEGLQVFDGDEPTLYQRLAHNPKLEEIFQNAMEEISNQAKELLAQHVDFSSVNKIVDVGGGNGTNIINLIKQFPNLEGVVFDSATVCERAKNNFQQNNLEERCDVQVGNCFEHEFPEDADAFIFCHFLTIWSAEKNCYLLKKAYDRLPSGGKVYIFNMMQNDNRDGPLTAAMGSPYFLTLATSEGMMYTWQEYKDWMISAGFDQVDCQILPADHGVIIGTKK